MLKGLFGLSLEEITDGQQRVEKELCFVARIVDFSHLQKADIVEKQDELALFLTPEGSDQMARMRIRRSTIEGQVTDVLTFKVRNKDEPYAKESSVDAPEGLYDVFALLPGVKQTVKTRYSFHTGLPTGELWEIDVFPNKEGNLSSWCKIDYEFKGSDKVPLPPFPQGLTDIVSAKTNNKEEREHVDNLFKNVFFAG